ncbi:MAG: hypothetical protein GY953_47370 [bacterium]|nr:hypothetical protein [bacterium]
MLTNSTFHYAGGSMDPFDGYSAAAGLNYDASGSYQYFESTPEGRRISPFLTGQIKDQRILGLLKKERFDHVLLVTRWNVFATEESSREELEAFKRMHEHIVRSGARTVVSVSYVTRDSTSNPDLQQRTLDWHRAIETALNGMVIDGQRHPIILAPTGVLWAAGVERFGTEAWFADKVHGTPLAQHASGCLFFTFITGADPRESTYTRLHTNNRFTTGELTPDQAAWIREQVWSLYQESRD